MAAHVLHSRRTDRGGEGHGRRHGPARRRIRLDEHLPVDHRLSRFYRVGAGLMGLVLVAFGILGLIDRIGFFDTRGDTVAGLNTNGALSVLSIAVGLLLFVGMVIGGNFASTVNMVLGILFILSGFVNLALLDRSFNPLAFRIQNVMFSFVVGVMLMFFGMYGRVSATLPHDNPYWKARHPEEAEREQRASRRRADLAAGQPLARPPSSATTARRSPEAAAGPAGHTAAEPAAGPPAGTSRRTGRRLLSRKPRARR
ncbi:DUF4383 domain-containing protein [Streptomyces peucetius]|uniref:DUF4383 domain-containing protein n=1 Tax=Streptomyces peucetius TaxID=1950 RepID=A0ABY6I4I0_STRPE|nr:DUF4383 domain-containing protein [Streptomyces peucetius]UYQ61903.1 DUF4383 domain-containing protein [Streptomyces peucetius]